MRLRCRTTSPRRNDVSELFGGNAGYVDMTEIVVQKSQTGWIPASPESQEYHAKQKLGAMARAKFVNIRNVKLHRKFFALLNLGFDYWEVADQEYKGEKVAKSFERFRKDVIILAGFYEPTFNVRGEVRLEAKSISFAHMDETEFENLYSTVVNVLLDRVLRAKGFSRETVDEVVDQLCAFA